MEIEKEKEIKDKIKEDEAATELEKDKLTAPRMEQALALVRAFNDKASIIDTFGKYLECFYTDGKWSKDSRDYFTDAEKAEILS